MPPDPEPAPDWPPPGCTTAGGPTNPPAGHPMRVRDCQALITKRIG